MEFVSRFVLRYSLAIIVVTILLTVFLGIFGAQIELKPGLKDMLPGDHQVMQTYIKAGEAFGGVNYLVVVLEDQDVLDAPTLQKVQRMTEAFAKVEGVEGVISLTNVSRIRGDLFGVQVSPLVQRLPETKGEIQELKDLLLESEQYIGSVVSADFTATTLLVKIRHEIAVPEEVARKVKKVAMGFAGPEQVYLTGSIVMANEAADYMQKDLARLFPFVLIVIFLILWLSFRNLQGIFLPLLTVLISVIWSVGIIALLGKSLSLVSVILPVLLVSVGSAYAIHIMTRYYEELEAGIQKEEALLNTLDKVGVAVLMAGGTTIAGFASLFFSNLVIIQDFALATSIGVGIALLISILFIPALFVQIPFSGSSVQSKVKPILSAPLFQGIIRLVLGYRPWILGGSLLLILASLWVIPGLQPDTNYNNYFKKNSPPRQAAQLVSDKFGGAASLEVIVHGNIKDPELLARMRDFQDQVVQIDGVNTPMSMVTVFQEEDQALHGRESSGQIPTMQRQIAQYLLLLNMADQSMLQDLLTFDQNMNRMQFRLSILESEATARIVEQVQELILIHFGSEYQVEMTGAPILTDTLTQLVISSQVKSLIGSIVFTFLITSLFLKSLRRGLVCSLPIALTVLVNFGVMGWFGISLDIATAMIASIAVGIGVDYSIHIYTRYLEERENGFDGSEAVQKAIYTVGRANLYNALTVVAGFGMILLSSFPPLIHFGGLTAITMMLSFVGAVLFLPTVILLSEKWSLSIEAWMKQKRIKDQGSSVE